MTGWLSLTVVVSSLSTEADLRAVVGGCCCYWDNTSTTSTVAATGALEDAAAEVNASWDGGSFSQLGLEPLAFGLDPSALLRKRHILTPHVVHHHKPP